LLSSDYTGEVVIENVVGPNIESIWWNDYFILGTMTKWQDNEKSATGDRKWFVVDLRQEKVHVFVSEERYLYCLKVLSIDLRRAKLLPLAEALHVREKEIGSRLSGKSLQQYIDTTRSLIMLSDATKMFLESKSRLPEDLSELYISISSTRYGGLIKSTDSWGHSYNYKRTEGSYDLWSDGPPGGKAIVLPDYRKKHPYLVFDIVGETSR
jgi:hypothetical protein